MNDRDVMARINDLVAEEHALLERSGAGAGLSAADRDRMQQVESTLDQLWDYLRQRRARRETGQTPDKAALRDPGIVEGYQQ